MKNNNNGVVHQFFDQLVTNYEEGAGIMWCYMNPHPRPSFNPSLLKDLNRFLKMIKNRVSSDIENYGSSDIKFIVFGSHQPGVFSLGGDLKLFLECINNSDKKKLYEYMRLSIDVMYSIYSNMNIPITTVSLIRGNALGAGFEGALSCDYIVAESGVQLGFPEVLFNMFPGMGAYSILTRRLEPLLAEEMILSGRIYTAEELSDFRLIEVVADKNKGVDEVYSLIKRIIKSSNTREAIHRMRNLVNPITHEELLRVGELWVDCAMSLSNKERKIMSRLIRSQDKMYGICESESGVALNNIV